MNANKIVTIICLILCIIALIAAPFCAIGAVEYSHTRTHEVAAVVDEVTNDCVVLVDWDGEAWVFEGDGYEIGQLVIIVFDDMGTANIYDDEIVEIRG